MGYTADPRGRHFSAIWMAAPAVGCIAWTLLTAARWASTGGLEELRGQLAGMEPLALQVGCCLCDSCGSSGPSPLAHLHRALVGLMAAGPTHPPIPQALMARFGMSMGGSLSVKDAMWWRVMDVGMDATGAFCLNRRDCQRGAGPSGAGSAEGALAHGQVPVAWQPARRAHHAPVSPNSASSSRHRRRVVLHAARLSSETTFPPAPPAMTLFYMGISMALVLAWMAWRRYLWADQYFMCVRWLAGWLCLGVVETLVASLAWVGLGVHALPQLRGRLPQAGPLLRARPAYHVTLQANVGVGLHQRRAGVVRRAVRPHD